MSDPTPTIGRWSVQAVLDGLPREMDADGWRLRRDTVDVQVYSKPGVFGCPVLAFKVVSTYPIAAESMARYLGDVPGAMARFGDARWLPPSDGLAMNQTAFRLPFPFADRVYIHGVATARRGDNSIVGYIPIDPTSAPSSDDYLFTATYPSGQRITPIGLGACRVEHLMISALGGRVAPWVQDRLLATAMTGAYVDEWRQHRDGSLPSIDGVDFDGLLETCHSLMEPAAAWPALRSDGTARISAGRTPLCPTEAFYATTDVAAPLDAVVERLGDHPLDALAEYNAEYVGGTVLHSFPSSPTRMAWLLQTRFRTPTFCADRSYTHAFARVRTDPETAWLLLMSVQHGEPPAGCARGLIHPSAHRLTARPGGGTRIEHVLQTDIGGRLGRLPGRWLRGSMVQALDRDNAALRRMFGA